MHGGPLTERESRAGDRRARDALVCGDESGLVEGLLISPPPPDVIAMGAEVSRCRLSTSPSRLMGFIERRMPVCVPTESIAPTDGSRHRRTQSRRPKPGSMCIDTLLSLPTPTSQGTGFFTCAKELGHTFRAGQIDKLAFWAAPVRRPPRSPARGSVIASSVSWRANVPGTVPPARLVRGRTSPAPPPWLGECPGDVRQDPFRR